MPATVVLALAIIGGVNASFVAVKNGATVVTTIKAIHHHTTKPLYTHVLKPVGKAVAQ
jgi:hypothetical protein